MVQNTYNLLYCNEQPLLALPHRQFVWTCPRILRPCSRYNRRLFSEISRLIFAIIERFYKKNLISATLATSLINWRHSGFSVNHDVRIPAFSDKARETLSQYITRPPISLKKLSIEENGEATLISYTSDNDFFKGKTETFTVTRFLSETYTTHPTSRRSIYSVLRIVRFPHQGKTVGRRCPQGGSRYYWDSTPCGHFTLQTAAAPYRQRKRRDSSYMAAMFSTGTSAWMLCTGAKI